MYQINLSNTIIEVSEDNYEKGEIRSFQKRYDGQTIFNFETYKELKDKFISIWPIFEINFEIEDNNLYISWCEVEKGYEPTENDWKDFEILIKRLEVAVRKAFQPSHFNWSCLMNLATMSGQETHVHWHIHPRYDKPTTIANETFEDTQWYPRKEKIDHVVDKEVLQVVAEKIRENL